MSAVKTKLMDSDIQKWLIVVDNADDPEILLSEDGPNGQRLKDYLPSRAGCKTLFTARDKHTAIQLIGVFDPILEIESLGLAEAQQLFEAIVPHARFTNDDCVKELLIELTCLPLAVVQAAAFIRENDINVETYLHLFREQDAEDESTDILGQEFEDETRYPKVGNALTTKYHRKTLQAMQDVGQDLMMRGQYSEAEAKHRKTFTLRFRYLGPADVETLGSMRNVADALGFQSKWEEYETLSKELTKLSAACYGSTHMITLSGLKALSVCQCQHGRFIYAEKLAREVVDGRKKAKGLGEMHPSTLKSISHLAIILGHNNKWSEAEALELHTSKSLELILGPMHPDTLTSKCNLARIWIHLEKLSAAKTMFYEILEARLKLLGSEHPDTRKSISYVSRFCKDQQLPECTRRFPEESPNPKHLVWTEHNNEGDMCAPPELDARFPEASEVAESLHQQGLTIKTEKYDDQAVQWELSWTEIDRLDLVWRCKSKSDITWKIIASVLPKLAPIDPEETWTWLKNNIPGLQSYPIRVPTPSLPVVEPSVELSDELFATSSLWAYGRTVSSNSRSSDGPSSIYRTALSSQRSQNCSGGQQNGPLADVMDLDMAKGPSIIRSFAHRVRHMRYPAICFYRICGDWQDTQKFILAEPTQRIVLGSDPESTINPKVFQVPALTFKNSNLQEERGSTDSF
ncbi:hypothetical protein D6C85_01950 [Aureobasidium pullulans]|uniref:Uncharacterized protein n=1 Tax=Aureobasidium pullulans TaxID=5580 RepID=A0A4S9Z455_AURPU|nr:hypothetical protein D6C85_01950 [Aureobasidium pullulans]TIA01469.1 hypothetical protein D6C82_03685 [Aureobasidium pullulans]